MTQFAKFISEEAVKIAPRNYRTPTLISFNFNQNEELMRQEGYYPLVEQNHREDVEDETHWAKPTYALVEQPADEPEEGEEVTLINNNYIAVTYVPEEIPDDPEEVIEETND